MIRTRMSYSKLLTLLLVATLGACSSRTGVGPDGQPLPNTGSRGQGGSGALQAVNVVEMYRTMGLISARGSVPFVARVGFFPEKTPDSTLSFISLSLPTRAISFARENDQYAGNYSVRMELRQNGSLIRQIEADEVVRVATFREIARSDESIIWQRYLRLAPGQYTLSLAVRDAGSPRSSSEEVSLEVPALPTGSLSSPIPVYDVLPRSSADSLPRLLARPRATAMFGVDSIVPVYVEFSGTREATSVIAEVKGESNRVLWSDSTVLLSRGEELVNGIINVPTASIGIGIVNFSAKTPNSESTSQTKLLVTLGDDLPVTGFTEMISYLRFFAPDYMLNKISSATDENRAQEWNDFLKATDPIPNTPEHEGLRDYFARIRLANQRFSDDGPTGWLSDRGTAFVGLGDPDNIYENPNNNISTRNRQQIWEYSQWRLRLVFTDQAGLGRWRLSPSGSVELSSTIRRKLSGMN